ncbi:MAG: 4Fe-4S dicluster domain-containing protein, partial [Acidobacteriota bacterium]|nr:4Fe-4S dicluster domain-containing protein [Acidobacteriota bacterium]
QNQTAPTTTAAAPAESPTAAPSADFEKLWRKAVHDGVIPGTEAQTISVSARGDLPGVPPPVASGGNALEIVFRPDPTIYDGRFANNGWLQELPKPLTKLTWDGVAFISPATARQFGLGNANNITSKGQETLADILRLDFRGRQVAFPVWIMPGQPDGVVTIPLGYGRWRAGRVGTITEGKPDNLSGFQNAYMIRTSDALWSGVGLNIANTGETYPLASTQLHFNIEDEREIIRAGTLEEYKHDPRLAPHRDEDKQPPAPAGENRHPAEHESLYPEFVYNGYKWGMAIDLSTCVGCNACIVACQAENNIPVVGKDQISRAREMHWLRVDAYFRGAMDNPQGVYFMPVPCMHCEIAPCEPVCPVHATVHSAEGLNDMVYNRCVGTRYCSNNCPYKVRRFNFLLYQDWNTPSLKLMRNPEVSVRSRGVMEKCTYCVQRIQYAKIEAEKENRRVRDGEIVTACQGACPTQAIVFGDLNDENSRVRKLHEEPRRYDLLADLNTRPRTVYLAAVRNPNPEMQ